MAVNTPQLPVYSCTPAATDTSDSNTVCVEAVALNLYHTSSSTPVELQSGAASVAVVAPAVVPTVIAGVKPVAGVRIVAAVHALLAGGTNVQDSLRVRREGVSEHCVLA